MEDLVNMIVADDSPSQITDRIKDILFAKSAGRVEDAKPYVASSLFGEEDSETYEEGDDEYEDDEEN